MASGFASRWKGKIMAQVIYLGTGGIVDAASGVGGRLQAAQRASLTVTAITNTDSVMSIPPGATIEAIRVFTTTAFTAVTDAQISIGNAAAGAQYVAAVSIKAVGIVNCTLVNAAAAALAAAPATPNIFIRIAQSGGNTAVGAATIVVSYLLP